jgi:hypothetical protein
MADVEKIKRGYEQAVENLTRYRKAYGDDIYTMATDAAIQDGLAALTLPAPEKVREAVQKLKIMAGVCQHVADKHRSDIPIDAHSFCEFLTAQKQRVEEIISLIQAAQQPVKKLDKLNIHILLDTLAEAARGKPLDPETCEIIENIAKEYKHTDFTAEDVQALYDCGAAQQPQAEGVTEDEAIRILDAAGYFKIVKQKGE